MKSVVMLELFDLQLVFISRILLDRGHKPLYGDKCIASAKVDKLHFSGKLFSSELEEQYCDSIIAEETPSGLRFTVMGDTYTVSGRYLVHWS